MKLRLCTITFKKKMRIQIGNATKKVTKKKSKKVGKKVIKKKTKKKEPSFWHVRWKFPGESIDVVEIGNMESFGRDHFCGVVSQQIVDVGKVKRNIIEIGSMSAEERLGWFKLNYPGADIIMVESNKLLDRLKNTNVKEPLAVISNVRYLQWDK